MIDLSTALLTSRQRLVVAAFACVVVLLTLGTLPIVTHRLGPNPVIFAAIYACFVTASGLTALAFGIQHRSSGAFEPGILAIAYTLLAVVTALYAVTFPALGFTAAVGATTATARWLWALWHLSFLSCILVYALGSERVDEDRPPARSNGREAVRRVGSAIAAIVTVLVALAWFVHGAPRALSESIGNDTRFIHAPLIVVLAVATLVALHRRSHGKRMLDAWLSLAVLVLLCATVTMAVGANRYTVGWWLVRAEHVTLGLVMIGVILSMTDRTFSHALRVTTLLSEQAMLDGLTAISNRRKFDITASDALTHAQHTREPLCFAILDIDRFKLYNDEFGHLAGDECLRAVARTLRETLRRERDFVARYGGEEFALILPLTDLAAAHAVCQRVRIAIEGLSLPHASTSLLQVVTISIGVSMTRPGETLASVLARADEALYRAKANGRNRVERETSETLAGTAVRV